MNKIIKYGILILVLYIFIHSPYLYLPGTRMGSVKLLYIPAFYLLITNGGLKSLFFRTFSTECKFFAIIFTFVLLRTAMGGQPIFVWATIVSFIEAVILPLFVISFLLNRGLKSKESIVRSLLLVGAVGTIISMLCLTIPPLNSFVRDNIMHITSDMRAFDHSFRGFGISESLSSQYGYIQGILFVLGAIYFKDNKWFAYFLPFVLLSAFINARTGVIVAAVGIIIYLLYNRNYIYSIIIAAVIVLLYANIEAFIGALVPDADTQAWISDFFLQMESMMDEGIEGSRQADILFGQMFILPDTPEQWVFGRGLSLFRNEIGIDSSDVGFILQLNYGGIMYLLLLNIFMLYLVFRLMKNNQKLFAAFFLAVYMILNIKSNYILDSGAFRLMMLLYYVMILEGVNLRMSKIRTAR